MIDPERPAPCVLIVEDEMQLAILLEDVLTEAGCHVLKAARVPAALALAEFEAIDAAILDINVAGTQAFPVADVLHRRSIPFMFASGYGDNGLVAPYAGWAMLQKPYGMKPLREALVMLLGDKATMLKNQGGDAS
jgi:DNA-binding response OmpR family regulator